MPEGPEPNGWELMRSIEGLRDEIRSVGGKVISSEQYKADQQGIDARFVRLEKTVDDFHTTSSDRDRTERDQAAENTRFRKNMNLAIALAVAGPVISLIISYFHGGGAGG